MRLLLFFITFFILTVESKSQTIPNFDSIRLEIQSSKNNWEKVKNIILLGTGVQAYHIDSVKTYINILAQEPDTFMMAKAGRYFLEGIVHGRSERLTEAENSLLQAIEGFKTLGQEDYYFKASNLLGTIYNRQRKFEESLNLYHELLKIPDLTNSQQKVVHGNLGIAYKRTNDFNNAITHFEHSYKADPNDSFSRLNNYLNISEIYMIMEEPAKALNTLKLVKGEEVEEHQIKISYYNTKARAFQRLNKIDSAIAYYKEGITLAIKLGNHHLVPAASASLLRIYVHHSEKEAENLIKRTTEVLDNNIPPVPLIDFKLACGEFYLSIKKYDLALTYFNKCLMLANNVSDMRVLKNVYHLMSLAYKGKGDEEKAFQLQARHISFTDSVKYLNNEAFLFDAQVRYSASEKEQQLEEAIVHHSFLESIIFQLSVVSLILIGGGAFFFIRYKKKKRLLFITKNEMKILNEQLHEFKIMAASVDIFPKYYILKSKAKIDLDELIYIYVDGHYLEFFIKNKERPEIDRNSLNHILQELPENQFIRVHRSFVVNINFVKAIYSTKVQLDNGKDLPVSRTFRKNLENVIQTDNVLVS